jgi:hypothetical protein
MDTSIIISIITLIITIVINAGAGFYWAGKISAHSQRVEDVVRIYQSKNDENFRRLEAKQDKHNNVIERVTIVEQSVKSAHHREDNLEKQIERLTKWTE